MRVILAFLALCLCLAAGVYGLSRWREEAAASRVEANIADAHFSYLAAYARDDATASGGFTDRLGFVALFPDFSPLPRVNPSGAPKRDDGARKVFVTISLKDETIDPAERPNRLYARFLEGEAVAGPGGLVMRRFERDSPYDLEQLYIAPPDGHSFFARCPKPQSGASEACLSLFRLGALDVELRFSSALLKHWEQLDEGARAFVQRLRAAEPGATSPRAQTPGVRAQ
jgi:hypothetical protein